MFKRKLTIRPVILGLSVLCAAGVGAFLYLQNSDAETSQEVYEGSDHAASHAADNAVAVQVVHPEANGVARISEQPGVVHPFEWTDVYSKVSGYFSLDRQPLEIGARVKEGDVIADIYSPELEKAVEQCQASLAQAKAVVNEMNARLLAAKAEEKAAEATVQQAIAETERDTALLTLRRKEHKRFQELFVARSIDEQLVDEKQDAYEAAVAAVDAAKANEHTAEAQVAVAKANVERANADLTTAQAKVQVAQADLDRAQVFLDYTHFRAPFDGVITLRNVHRGDFIQVGVRTDDGPLYRLARTDVMRVIVEVPDRIAPFVEAGDKAEVFLDSLPGRKFEGQVARISYAEDNKTRTMRCEVDLKNDEGLLRSGMYGLARIIAQTPSSDAVRIPSSCLVGKVEGGVGSVYVVRDGHAHLTEVVVGYDDGDVAEILKGLTTSDRVVTRNSSVQDGFPVVVEDAAQ